MDARKKSESGSSPGQSPSFEKEIHLDTLIIGAGVIGSSVAMHLGQKRGESSTSSSSPQIRVIDFDLEGSLSSSELNAGGVRGTWNQPINIQMSQMTIDYLALHAEEVGYRDCGYLWLHTEERWDQALQAREVQVQMGWPVDVLGIRELRSQFPFIDRTEGIAGALFGQRDGLVNPNRLKNHFREKAAQCGVRFDDRTLLRSAEYDAHSSHPWKLTCERFEGVLSHETKLEVLGLQGDRIPRHTVVYRAQSVVNCAGAWAKSVADIFKYSSPVYPVRRQVSLFDCRELDLTPYGMIVDTSGVYFHPEATYGLTGIATPETSRIDFHYEGETFFQEQIWPHLYERSSAFEKLRHVTGWAGLYEVSPDECAVIGAVKDAPSGLYEAHSFSGHGVMHSYAAGLALAEKILDGRYQTIDAEVLSAERFQTGRWIREKAVI